MKNKFFRSIAVVLLVLFFIQSSWATCGGGGGGGGGGMSNGGGGGSDAPTYPVPRKIFKTQNATPSGLILYWFPANQNEIKNSSLRQSRALSLYASQCVAMEVADTSIP